MKLSEASNVAEEWKEIIKSPIDVFKGLFSDDLVLNATNQSNLYAAQRGEDHLNIFEDEIRIFIAVLLL